MCQNLNSARTHLFAARHAPGFSQATMQRSGRNWNCSPTHYWRTGYSKVSGLMLHFERHPQPIIAAREEAAGYQNVSHCTMM
jgi:hypothetical protein